MKALASWRNMAKAPGLVMRQIRPCVFSSNHMNPMSP